MDPVYHMDWTLPDNDIASRMIRHILKSFLQDLNVKDSHIGDIEAIITELCFNAERHAKSPGHKFYIHFNYWPGYIVLEVEDKGIGFDPTKVQTPGTERPDFNGQIRFGGYGEVLVNSLADSVKYLPRDIGTCVEIRKRLEYA